MAKNKFTLIELLVVVAIIGILASLLLPSLQTAREKAKFAVCTSNRDQIYKGMMVELDDHDGLTPMIQDGFYNNPANPTWEKDDWMGSNRGAGGELINGVIGLYVPNYKELARCPSLKKGTPGDRKYSNGFYDYTHMASMARIRFASLDTTMLQNNTERPTPWTLEESPNSINGGNREGAFAASDYLGNWHDFGKKGGYAAYDGHAVVIYHHGTSFTANSMQGFYNGVQKPLSFRDKLEKWPRTY